MKRCAAISRPTSYRAEHPCEIRHNIKRHPTLGPLCPAHYAAADRGQRIEVKRS